MMRGYTKSKQFYSSDYNRERRDSIGEETTYMKVWGKLSKTELPPNIITKCNNLTREGVLHYINKDYENAVKKFREAASYGHAPALANFGKCYYDGKGVNESKILGMRYFEMVAEKGNEFAISKVYEFEMLRFFMYNSPQPPGVK